jgi:hypothetical protein
MKLTKQQRKVFDYISAHRGCTTKDIQRDTGIECPSGRITEMRKLGLIEEIGTLKYPGSRAFVRYAAKEQRPRFQYVEPNGVMYEITLPA